MHCKLVRHIKQHNGSTRKQIQSLFLYHFPTNINSDDILLRKSVFVIPMDSTSFVNSLATMKGLLLFLALLELWCNHSLNLVTKQETFWEAMHWYDPPLCQTTRVASSWSVWLVDNPWGGNWYYSFIFGVIVALVWYHECMTSHK